MTTMMSGWKIMIYQLVPCRGGTETFAHATETKPWWINFPFNVHHRRLIWASCIGESIFRSKKFWSLRQNLRRAAVVIASAIVIGIASVLKQRSSIQRWILAPSSSWHHHLHLILTVIILAINRAIRGPKLVSPDIGRPESTPKSAQLVATLSTWMNTKGIQDGKNLVLWSYIDFVLL